MFHWAWLLSSYVSVTVNAALSQQVVFDKSPSSTTPLQNTLRLSNLGVDSVHTEPCFPGSLEYSGYLDTQDGKHLFFRFFESRHDPEQSPFLLWMNGGPGSSSANGYLLEAGPCTIINPKETIYNPYSWTERANIMFLDQPVGTGYSYFDDGISPVTSSERAALDIHTLLESFFQHFPKYRALPFHIMGESYGGHYAPHLAKLLQSNEMVHPINLNSIILINALVDPLIQIEYDVNFVCDPSRSILDPEGIACIRLKQEVQTSKTIFRACNEDSSKCSTASKFLFENILSPLVFFDHNPYDFTKPCNRSSKHDGPSCYQQSMWIAQYLNQTHIKNRLGVDTNFNFYLESDQVFNRFVEGGDGGKSTLKLLEELVQAGVRILAMNGDRDTLCDYTGAQAWVESLNTSFHDDFKRTRSQPWFTSDGVLGGTKRAAGNSSTAGNVTFVRVYGAGHMAPMDQPQATLDVFWRWIRNVPI